MEKTKPDLSRRLIREIAKELGTSYEEVFSIVNTQSKYTAEVIQYSGFETVTLPYLGKFMVKPARLKKLNDNMMNKRRESISGGTRKSEPDHGSESN